MQNYPFLLTFISAFLCLICCCLSRYQILFVFFVSILFSISLSSLFWYHIWLLLHNRYCQIDFSESTKKTCFIFTPIQWHFLLHRSTLEQFRAPMFENNHSDPEGWSLGKLDNIREVLKDFSRLLCGEFLSTLLYPKSFDGK